MIARRNFVMGAAAGLAAASVGAAGLPQGGSAGSLKARFGRLLGQTFTADSGSGRLHLRLARVIEHPAARRFEQFTLAFEETSGRSGAERIYAVKQTGSGFGGYRADLFLQPGGRKGAFTAAFSVLKA